MADVTRCDNCGQVLGDESDDIDLEAVHWIKVGFRGFPPFYDACTIECARQLLDGTMTDDLADSLSAGDDE